MLMLWKKIDRQQQWRWWLSCLRIKYSTLIFHFIFKRFSLCDFSSIIKNLIKLQAFNFLLIKKIIHGSCTWFSTFSLTHRNTSLIYYCLQINVCSFCATIWEEEIKRIVRTRKSFWRKKLIQEFRALYV